VPLRHDLPYPVGPVVFRQEDAEAVPVLFADLSPGTADFGAIGDFVLFAVQQRLHGLPARPGQVAGHARRVARCLPAFEVLGFEVALEQQSLSLPLGADDPQGDVVCVWRRLQCVQAAVVRERLAVRDLAGLGVDPFGVVGPARQVHHQPSQVVSVDVDRVGLARLHQRAGRRARGQVGGEDRVVRTHPDEIEAIDEVSEDAQLSPELGTASPGRVDLRRAVFVPDRKRVVQVAVDGAAGDDEIPSFESVRLDPVIAGESGFVVANDPIPMIILRHGNRGLGVVEVEDRDVGAWVLDDLRLVGDVLGDQVPVLEPGLGAGDGLGDMVLPVQRHATEVRLVADLIVDVIEILQRLGDLADHRFLDRQQLGMPERVDRRSLHGSHVVDVVAGVHRAQVPHAVLVERAEQDQLHHDAAPARLRDEVGQTLEVLRIPFRQVEPVAPVGIASDVAPRPGAEQVSFGRSERVPLDVERSRRLAVGAAERTRQVESVGL